MPNPGKYKSVGVSIEAYDKLVIIAESEDRAIGRQLARMIDETFEQINARVNTKRQVPNSFGAVGLGGLSSVSVIED
jgi:hypothetical protein